MLTEEKWDSIRAQLEHLPVSLLITLHKKQEYQKGLQEQLQYYLSCGINKTTVLQFLYPHGLVARLNFCNCIFTQQAYLKISLYWPCVMAYTQSDWLCITVVYHESVKLLCKLVWQSHGMGV